MHFRNIAIGKKFYKKKRGRIEQTSPIEFEDGAEVQTKDMFPLWIFHPYEPIRLGWDAVITFVMIYVLFAIPVQICFLDDLPETYPFVNLELLADAFFIFDIIFNFNTGYINEQSQFVSARKSIALKYLRGWFWIDIFTSIPLVFIPNLKTVSILSKILKAVRVVRLIRLLKVMTLISKWEQGVNSSIISVLKFLILIFIIAHTFACFFVGIENIYRDQHRSYENYFGFAQDSWFVRFQDTWEQPILIKYLRALYWAFTTLTTVGYGDVTPLLPLEIVFTIFVQLCGSTLFGFIIGNVASVITSKDSTGMMIQEKLEAVNNYIHYRQLPQFLSNKILRHYGYAWQRSQVFKEDEITSELPQGLRTECAVFIHHNIIKTVPFLSKLSDEVLPSLVTRLKPALASNGDAIVLEGLFGCEMYFVSKGRLAAVASTFLSGVKHMKQEIEEIRISEFLKGACFAEYTVMVDQIRHPQTVLAESYCDLFFLTRTDFVAFGETFPLVAKDIVRKMTKGYLDLVEGVMKRRHHHTLMLSLALKNLDQDIFQATLHSYLQKSTVVRISEGKGSFSQPDDPKNDNIHFQSRRLSVEMKAAPIVPFSMRHKYHNLLKREKENVLSEAQHTRERTNGQNLRGALITQFFKDSVRFLAEFAKKKEQPLDLSALRNNNVFAFNPNILLKVLKWKDRARVRVMAKKLQGIENQFISNTQELTSSVDESFEFQGANFSKNRETTCKEEINALKGLVFAALGGINRQQETMKSDLKEMKRMVLALLPAPSTSNI